MAFNDDPTADGEQLPICANCKWSKESRDTQQHQLRCHNPKAGISLVDGAIKVNSCSWHRAMKNYQAACCRGGHWYEAEDLNNKGKGVLDTSADT